MKCSNQGKHPFLMKFDALDPLELCRNAMWSLWNSENNMGCEMSELFNQNCILKCARVI